ncbi:MAG: hypothetical protein M3347_15730 [Armatimonadota bacterium]|nr:hypothetical protein [Armatimonadota bacterium]
MTASNSTVGPITHVTAPEEQHMLLLFFPLKAGTLEQSLSAARDVFTPPVADDVADVATTGPDPRIATGVHFFMVYGLPAGKQPEPTLPVPSFQTAPGKDLLVVLSLYDADFRPYISAFTSNPPVALGLNAILTLLDETGIVDPTDPTSAAFILYHGGVAQNNTAFLKLLMRYNFADPTIPGAVAIPGETPPPAKYFLGATFPGLTIGSILQNYPDAPALWPNPPVKITFEPSNPPPSD